MNEADDRGRSSTQPERRAPVGRGDGRPTKAAARPGSPRRGRQSSRRMQPSVRRRGQVDDRRRSRSDLSRRTAGDRRGAPGLQLPTAAGPVALDTIADVDQVEGPSRSPDRRRAQRHGDRSRPPARQPRRLPPTALHEAAGRTIDLPAGATCDLGGVSADQADAFGQLGLALLAAILIVYMVMVATFRSLRAAADPAGLGAVRGDRRDRCCSHHRHPARRAVDDRRADAGRHRGDQRDRAVDLINQYRAQGMGVRRRGRRGRPAGSARS